MSPGVAGCYARAAMTAETWSDAMLDAMRQVGDPPADAAVASLLDSGDERAVQSLMDTLVRNDQLVPHELPPPLVAYFETVGAEVVPPSPRVLAGEQFFAAYGPEIVMLLGCYSLPAAYAAKKGVQVLYRTGFLARRPNRRLFETAQMVIDVMSPGGLGPGGRGVRTAQKVRLMHAAIRHLIRTDPAQPWDTAALGVPINQEDLAGTLMTFSWIVLDGLKQMRVPVTDEQAAAYLDAWRAVGQHMGVRPELIPHDLAGAEVLTHTIQRRQIAPSDEGRALTQALLEMFDANLPRALDGLPPALMRMFLDRYPGVCEGLGIPEHKLEDRLVAAAAELGGEAIGRLDGSIEHRRLLRRISLAFLQFIVNVDRGGQRAQFHVPVDLTEYWSLPPEEQTSFWSRLWQWFRDLFSCQKPAK